MAVIQIKNLSQYLNNHPGERDNITFGINTKGAFAFDKKGDLIGQLNPSDIVDILQSEKKTVKSLSMCLYPNMIYQETFSSHRGEDTLTVLQFPPHERTFTFDFKKPQRVSIPWIQIYSLVGKGSKGLIKRPCGPYSSGFKLSISDEPITAMTDKVYYPNFYNCTGHNVCMGGAKKNILKGLKHPGEIAQKQLSAFLTSDFSSDLGLQGKGSGNTFQSVLEESKQ